MGEISRKPSSPLPAVSYELLVVLLLCVVPFVRLRGGRSAPLLLLLLLFDWPPLMGDAIRLLIASVGSTEKLSPKPLSSSEFGVVLELEVKMVVKAQSLEGSRSALTHSNHRCLVISNS